MNLSRTDKITLAVAALAAAVLIAWLLWRRYSAPSTAQTAAVPASTSAPDWQASFAGPSGYPAVPQIQNGQANGVFQLDLGSITLPGFHYSGNEQIYMPMFGFVGYSNYASG